MSRSEETPSKTPTGRSPSASQMASMASRVRPPENTESLAKSVRSPSSSRSWLHSMAPRRVRWRAGRSLAPPVRSLRRLERRVRRDFGWSILTRAAASSMARGNPSSLTQISAMAGALSAVISKPRFAALARSMNSLTASYWERTSMGGSRLVSGTESGGTA